MNRDFHFACSMTKEYTPECPARDLFRIRSNGKAPFLPRGSSAQAKKGGWPTLKLTTNLRVPQVFRRGGPRRKTWEFFIEIEQFN